MIINCREWGTDHDYSKAGRRRVFVDGVEIQQVWYVDTGCGEVRTFDVAGDVRPHLAWEKIAVHPDSYDRGDGVLSRTIRGVVELRPL